MLSNDELRERAQLLEQLADLEDEMHHASNDERRERVELLERLTELEPA